MKKIIFDKQYLKISLYILFIILISIAFEKTVGNVSILFTSIKDGINIIIGILSPFVYGFFIAYFINSLVKFFENKILTHIPQLNGRNRAKRVISIFCSYMLFVGCIIWIIAYLLPEITDSFKNLLASLQKYLNSLETGSYREATVSELTSQVVAMINDIFNTSYTLDDVIALVSKPVSDMVSTFPDVFNRVLTGTMNIASGVISVFLGIIISLYMLFDKETYSKAITKLLFTIFSRITAARILENARTSNIVIEKFIIGKALDSLIIGIIFFFVALVAKMPFLLLSSVIIGVTNMIPYFGPFIGAVPVIFITLLVDPVKAVWVTIIIFVLQQFDGNILGPKILGDSTGLKPMGVILAIIVGGALFGVMGMFFGVPIFAVLKNMLSAFLDRKYKEKYNQIDIETIEDKIIDD